MSAADDRARQEAAGGQDPDIPAEVVARWAELDADPLGFTSICRDCGIDAWGFEEDGEIVTEEFYVSNELWDQGAPDDEVIRWDDGTGQLAQGRFVLCIGCFEHRLGRTLTAGDIGARGDPPQGASARYRDRWRATASIALR